MKRLFFVSIGLLILLEIALVYFIMPMPGSQRWEMAEFSHFLFTWRWIFRIIFCVGVIAGSKNAFVTSKWIAAVLVILFAVVAYLFNGPMTASNMFKPMNIVKFAYSGKTNQVSPYRQVLGVLYKGEVKAYSVQLLGYHHRVEDSMGVEPILVTFCTVCHTGRVYSSMVDGVKLHFDLVGMDQMNAVFADRETGSWWQQATGECVAGKLKGNRLKEIPSSQMRLQDWIAIHPLTLVLQPDTAFTEQYSKLDRYEAGKSKGELTKRNPESWKEKSWVLGMDYDDSAVVVDWNLLLKKRIIVDSIAESKFVLWLGLSNEALYGFFIPNDIVADFKNVRIVEKDLLVWPSGEIAPNGKLFKYIKHTSGGYQIGMQWLEPAPFYKEYWHSWRTFHPTSRKIN